MRYFDQQQVHDHLSMKECIQVMQDLFRLPTEAFLNPLRPIMRIPSLEAVVGMMPAYIAPYNVFGVKVLSIFHHNHAYGISSHQGVMLLFEAKHGVLIASFNADSLTAIRTAAVTAVSVDILAKANATTLALMGTGVQGVSHLEAMLAIRPIERVNVWSRTPANRVSFIEKQQEKYPNLIFKNCETAQEATQDVEIICTLTASPTPVVRKAWLQKGCHITAVGSSTPTARELDTELIKASKLFIDNEESTMNEAGNILIPIQEGAITKDHIKGTLHELITKKIAGRTNDDELTVFSSVGIGIEDVASANFILKKS